jgi:hypothetical protein
MGKFSLGKYEVDPLLHLVDSRCDGWQPVHSHIMDIGSDDWFQD